MVNDHSIKASVDSRVNALWVYWSLIKYSVYRWSMINQLIYLLFKYIGFSEFAENDHLINDM